MTSAASVRRPGALRAAPPAKPGSRAGAARGAGVRAADGVGGRRRGRSGRRHGRRARAAALGSGRAVFNTRTLPPVETAVGSYRRITTAHGGRILPPVHPAVTTFRRTNRRLGDIFEKKNKTYISEKSKKKTQARMLVGLDHNAHPSYYWAKRPLPGLASETYP